MIKEINKLFKDIATSHLMINQFESGDTFNIQKKDNIYPQLFLEDDSDSITYIKNYKSYSVAFYIFELPKEDLRDYLELKHKIELINSDIIQQLFSIPSDIFHEISNVESLFLKEYSNDSVVAIRTQITFKVLNLNNLCESPI